MTADPSKYFNYNRANSDFAKQMRREPTYGEKIMRNMLRKDSTGYRFLRQKNFGPYILDFYCSKLNLCIEVDGPHHLQTIPYDKARDQFLAEKGVHTLRIDSDRLIANTGIIRDELIRWIEGHTNPTLLK